MASSPCLLVSLSPRLIVFPLQSVVLRQFRVRKGVVGIEQRGERAVVADEVGEEGRDFIEHRLTQRSRVFGEAFLVGAGERFEVAEAPELRGEIRRERRGTWVFEHALRLSDEHGGFAQLVRSGKTEQLVIRDARPEEEREARGECVRALRESLLSSHQILRTRNKRVRFAPAKQKIP